MLAMDNNITSQGSLYHFGPPTTNNCSYRNKYNNGLKTVTQPKRSDCVGGENVWQDKWHSTHHHLGVMDNHTTASTPHLPLHYSMSRAPMDPPPSLTTGIPPYNPSNKGNYAPNLTAPTIPPPPNVFQWHQTFCDQPNQQPLIPTVSNHPSAVGSTTHESGVTTPQQQAYSVNNRFDMFLRNQNQNYLLSSFHDPSTNWCQQPSSTKDAFSPPSATKNTCPVCGKNYARPSTLKTHMRIHSGERPFLCDVCNKSFSQAANLTAHLRVHSGEKPFSCSICHKTFSQSSSVTTHMRTHSGDRPYKCPMCRKGFSDSSTLTKHLRIHSGEKPYQCNFCAMSFSQSGNLNRHMKVHEQSRSQINDESMKNSSPQ